MIWKQLVKLAMTSQVLQYLKKFSAYVPYDVDSLPPVFAPSGSWMDDADERFSLKGYRNTIVKVMILMDDTVPATTFAKIRTKGTDAWVDERSFATIECSAERTSSCKGELK